MSLENDLGWADHRRAWYLLMETLHALRDLLPADDAVKLGAQLPFLVRGAYFDGWIACHTPAGACGKNAFVGAPLDDPENVIRAVLDLLRRRVSSNEFDNMARAMRNQSLDLCQPVGGQG